MGDALHRDDWAGIGRVGGEPTRYPSNTRTGIDPGLTSNEETPGECPGLVV